MRDIKQAFWIAGQNFYGWKKSPRIWMTFILAAILCLMLSDQIISHAIKYETILQVFEPFIWTYGDASSVMLSSLLLILLFADMPFISQARWKGTGRTSFRGFRYRWNGPCRF